MNNSYEKFKVLGVLAIAAISIWLAYPFQDKLRLGLDLRGGMQLTLQVETGKIPVDSRDDLLERVLEIIRNRIDEFGVQEPMISGLGRDKIVVQLPGVTDRERALNIVGKAAHLEFKLVSDSPDLVANARRGSVPEGYDLRSMETDTGKERLLVRKDAVLSGSHLKNASVGFDEFGKALVHIEFDSKGATIFEEVTSRYVGKRLAIVLDGKLHSAPVIQERIPNGKAQITGNFTDETAHDLALVLRAGSLPAPVKIIEERTIGPSLGKESIVTSLTAALIGASLVFAFMPGYYLLAGLVADIGLIVYGIVVIGALSALSAVLTLPGIAGFILSIGMAVDANILINERIREEKQAGKSAHSAVHAGFSRAFSAILDSNVTTLLTSLILFIFGTGPVKGFAVTLSIGIIASMFSTLFVSRLVFDWLIRRNPRVNLKMFRLFDAASISFLRRRIWAYGFSALTIVVGVVGFVGRGQGNFGVEFVGGTLAQVRFRQPPDIGHVREVLEKEAVKEPMIQPYGSASENQIVIRVTDTDLQKVESALRRVAGDQGYEIMRVERIGPAVSQDLRIKSLWAILLAMAGIFGYLAWRFDRVFAVAAVIALLHDTVFTLGVFSLSGREISLPIVAAMLTIMGYSVNDTIVTFDRVRDNLKLKPTSEFRVVFEAGINQTLSRTVLTSFSTLLCVAALYLYGGPAINDFAFTLLVGFSVGIYSTIFVAGALAVDWHELLTPSQRQARKMKTTSWRKDAP
jgi:SecD/SecF fusion protein